MSLTIRDTGTPSGKCFITLYKENKSDKYFFEQIDNITLEERLKKQSKYMSGLKRDGVYYLFIYTSDLEPGYYLLHAEVTFRSENLFEGLFLPIKYANKLLYIPPTGKEENR
jgi:hypothetical protein